MNLQARAYRDPRDLQRMRQLLMEGASAGRSCESALFVNRFVCESAGQGVAYRGCVGFAEKTGEMAD